MRGNISSLSLEVGMRLFLDLYTSLAVSNTLNMRCLVSAEANTIGMSTKGAMRWRMVFS